MIINPFRKRHAELIKEARRLHDEIDQVLSVFHKTSQKDQQKLTKLLEELADTYSALANYHGLIANLWLVFALCCAVVALFSAYDLVAILQNNQ
jgi:ADP-heptose:LPS heptosyltransferase